MKCLEDELVSIGSYYLRHSERLLGQNQLPYRDRQELVCDLL